MSRVQKIELFHVEIPLPKTLSPAHFQGLQQKKQVMTVVRLTTDDGVQGVSAGWALGKEREGLKDWLPGAFLGLDALGIPRVAQRLEAQARWGWNNHWLEAAFWDLRGKIEGRPMYQLFMEEPATVEAVQVYASGQELQALDTRLRSIEQVRLMNVNAVGVPLTGHPQEDLAYVQELRRMGGDDLLLILDAGQANRAWVEDHRIPEWKLSEALDFAAAVDPLRIEWLENPLGMYAYGDLSVLRSESTVPIAGGSLNAGWHEFKILVDRGSLDVYRPNATVSGGVSTVLQIMDACLRRDLFFSPHCGPNSFSLLINLHLYAACPRKFLFEFPLEPGRWTPEIRDALLTEPLQLNSEGELPVPQGPGLGVEINDDALREYGTLWLDVEA